MTSIATPRPGAVATRIARLLRPAALRIDAWVSTEAAVQLPGHPLLRPAVLVAAGDPPYDGVALTPPLLVVELDAEKVARWLPLGLAAVWGPDGAGVVEISQGVRRIRTPGEHLTVAGHAELVLPVAELLRQPPLATVVALHG